MLLSIRRIPASPLLHYLELNPAFFLEPTLKFVSYLNISVLGKL